MAKNIIMSYKDYEVRVMSEAEGWSMVRRKGAMPFVVRSSTLSQPTKRASDGAIWRCDYCDCSNQGYRQTCWQCGTPRA